MSFFEAYYFVVFSCEVNELEIMAARPMVLRLLAQADELARSRYSSECCPGLPADEPCCCCAALAAAVQLQLHPAPPAPAPPSSPSSSSGSGITCSSGPCGSHPLGADHTDSAAPSCQ